MRRAAALVSTFGLLLGVAAGCRGTDGATPASTTGASTAVTPAVPTTSVAAATPAASTTAETAAASATTGDAPPPPESVPLPTSFLTVEKAVRDPDTGAEIAVTKVARQLAWPPGNQAQQTAFELVGVEVRLTPSNQLTAPLRAADIAIATTSPYPNRPDPILDQTLTAAGWTVLPTSITAAQLPAGQTSITGWLVFKIEPKDAPALRLDYTRPAMKVTDSGQTLAKQVFSIPLVG